MKCCSTTVSSSANDTSTRNRKAKCSEMTVRGSANDASTCNRKENVASRQLSAALMFRAYAIDNEMLQHDIYMQR